MPPRSLTDLLAEQPPEQLETMLETARKELARLSLEVQLIEQALARHSRKNRGGRRTRAGGDRITRDQVFEAVEGAGEPVTPSDVVEALAARGLTATPNAVRNHLLRLVQQNQWLIRLDDGRFAVSPAHTFERITTTHEDDIPF